MTRDQFNELMPWFMLNTMYLRLIFHQNQEGRPLTQEEVDRCNEGMAKDADDMLRGYRDGFDLGPDVGPKPFLMLRR